MTNIPSSSDTMFMFPYILVSKIHICSKKNADFTIFSTKNAEMKCQPLAELTINRSLRPSQAMATTPSCAAVAALASQRSALRLGSGRFGPTAQQLGFV